MKNVFSAYFIENFMKIQNPKTEIKNLI